MSSLVENKEIEFPQQPAGTVIVGTTVVEVRQMSDKGFDFIAGVGEAYTATLQGSVSGLNWTDIDTLAASAQGVVPVHYNLVRVNVTVGGALGTGNKLIVSGKVL